MGRMTKYLAGAAALVVAGLFAGPYLAKDKSMIVDLTVYMADDLIKKGGVVFVMPKEVPPEEFSLPEDLANPASERGVEAEGPVLGAVVRAQVNVVELRFPEGSSYTYRFRALESGPEEARVRTKHVGVGQGNSQNPLTGEWEAYELVQTHHFEVPTGDWSEEDSRAARVNTGLGFLRERYDAVEFQGASVFDATRDRLQQ